MTNPNIKKPTYSIVLLIFHRYKRLIKMTRDCIKTVKDNSEDYELIIVDNGSTVRYDWEKECDTYIRLNGNWGISHGWNTGLKVARGKYLVVIGDDILATEAWLERMKEGILQPDAGMCNPRIEHLPAGKGVVENHKWPSGACFMLSRNTINKVGYFDEEVFYPANWEDWDYWVRIYKAGLKIYTNFEGNTIRHLEGQTVHAGDISIHSDTNKQRFISKHGFDATNVFCGDVSIYDALSKAR